MIDETNELPQGWVRITFDELILLSQNGCSKRKSNGGKPTIVLRLSDIHQNRISWNDVRRIGLTDGEIDNYKLLEDDLICIRVNGSRSLVGRILKFRHLDGEEVTFCDHFIRFKLVIPQSATFFSLYFDTEGVRQHINLHMVSTAGQNTVSQGTVTSILVPVPPLPEQQRIVTAIEQHFTRLDVVVASLRRDKERLKQARAAVLRDAVEGRLTEKWRMQHPAVETGSELLQRILAERRAKWEEEQVAKGKDPQKMRYVEPRGPNVGVLSALPEGWCWATVEQVSALVKYGTSAKTSDAPDGVPVLRMGNIQDGNLDTDKLKYLEHNHYEFPELFLQEGDLLFNRTNSPELVGKSAVYHGVPAPCSYASYLICVRMMLQCIPDYLCFFLNSVYGRRWVKSVVSQQVGQANVNGTKLQALSFPVPPLAEQQQIVAEVERRLSIIAYSEAIIETNLKRAERLRQSILKKAFSGQLVPQNPRDEPASVLLERIRAQRMQGSKNAEATVQDTLQHIPRGKRRHEGRMDTEDNGRVAHKGNASASLIISQPVLKETLHRTGLWGEEI